MSPDERIKITQAWFQDYFGSSDARLKIYARAATDDLMERLFAAPAAQPDSPNPNQPLEENNDHSSD